MDFDTFWDLISELDEGVVGCAEAAAHYRGNGNDGMGCLWERARDQLERALRTIEAIRDEGVHGGCLTKRS